VLTNLSAASLVLVVPEEERRDLLRSLEKYSIVEMPSREEKIKILETFE
jgi:predicted glycosyltransferase